MFPVEVLGGVATGLPPRLCPSDRTASVFYALIWNIDVNFSVSKCLNSFKL